MPSPEPNVRPRRALAWLLVAVVAALAAGAIGWAFFAELGGASAMSVHGWIALGLGFLFSGALGGGLMWLASYSSRRGYDEEVGKEE